MAPPMQRDLQIEVQRIHGVRVVELDAELVERGLNEAVKRSWKNVADEESDGEIDGGVDDALAQLLEVLHEAHAGELGALGDGFARFFDGVCGSTMMGCRLRSFSFRKTASLGFARRFGGEKFALLRGSRAGTSAATVSPAERRR